jgi:hypothetical protein
LLFAIISLFFKESGIVWLVLPPIAKYLLDCGTFRSIFYNKNLKNSIYYISLGLLIIAAYFLIRTNLSDPNYIAPERYRLKISYNVIVNLALLLGNSFTTLDSMALFVERNWVLVSLTVLCSLPLLYILFQIIDRAVRDQQKRGRNILLLSFILIVSGPHLLLGRIGEMHVYSTFVLTAIIMAFLAEHYYKKNKKILWILLVYGITAVGVDFHKGYYIYESGMKGHRLALAIDTKQTGKPDNVQLIMKENTEETYSVFYTPTSLSFCGGTAYKWLKEYKYPKNIKCKILSENDFTKKNIDKYLLETDDTYECAWIIDGGTVNVINNLQQYKKQLRKEKPDDYAFGSSHQNKALAR